MPQVAHGFKTAKWHVGRSTLLPVSICQFTIDFNMVRMKNLMGQALLHDRIRMKIIHMSVCTHDLRLQLTNLGDQT